MNVLVDSIPVYYQDSGQGQVVLLLHGWGSDSSTFVGIEPVLSNNFRVISLDLPGFGKTKEPSEGWDLASYCKFINHFLEKIGVNHIYAVIGHSMGGRIALKAASTGVFGLDKIILIGSHGIKEESKKKTFLSFIADIGKALYMPPKVKEKAQNQFQRMFGSEDYQKASDIMKESFKQIIDEDLQEAAKNVTKPTLLIYGTLDTDTPPRFGETFNDLIQGSKLHIIAGAGHYTHLDAEDQVVQLITEHLA